MSRNAHGHLSIWGEFDPADITSALGLQPSSVVDRGEVLEVLGAPHVSPIATWDFYCPEDARVTEQVDFLLEKLSSRVEIMQKLTARYKAEFNLAPFEGDVLILAPGTLSKMAELGVTVNCFCWKDEDDDADSL